MNLFKQHLLSVQAIPMYLRVARVIKINLDALITKMESKSITFDLHTMILSKTKFSFSGPIIFCAVDPVIDAILKSIINKGRFN